MPEIAQKAKVCVGAAQRLQYIYIYTILNSAIGLRTVCVHSGSGRFGVTRGRGALGSLGVVGTSLETTSLKITPLKATPLETTSLKITPLKATPLKTTPLKTNPLKATSLE